MVNYQMLFVVCDNIEIGGMKFVLLMRIDFGISDVNVSRSISKIIGIWNM